MRNLTRYLTSLYLSRFLLLLVGLMAFVLSIDLMGNADEAIESRDGDFRAVFDYALLRLPEIASDFIKIASLLASLMTLTYLIRHSEMTAIWNTGVSQFGMLRRLFLVALLLGGVQFIVDNQLIPESVAQLRAWKVGEYGEDRDRHSKVARSALWLRIGSDVVRIPPQALDRKTLRDVTIFRRDSAGRLLELLEAKEAFISGGQWRLKDVTSHPVDGQEPTTAATAQWPFPVQFERLQELTVHPRELSFINLRRMLRNGAQGWWPPRLYETWLQVKIAVCFAPFLMIFLVIGLAQRFQRSGHIELLFIGGIALGFAYFIFNGISLAMGEVGALPPIAAAWAPNVLFATIAGSLAFWHEAHEKPKGGKLRGRDPENALPESRRQGSVRPKSPGGPGRQPSPMCSPAQTPD